MRALVSQFLLILCLFHAFTITAVLATPITRSPSSIQLQPRERYILRNNSVTGTLQAFNPVTRQPVPQGQASDGSGKGFDASSGIWIAFSFVVGTPLSLAGIRGWRMTTGVGLGLSAAVCAWSAFVNTMGATGISDIVLTAIVLSFFGLGFIFGMLEMGRIAGTILLGVTGGLSFGIRCMLLRPGLLIPAGSDGSGAGFAVAWVLVAILGLLGGGWAAWPKHQRSGMLFACVANGTFLVALGSDIIVNRQAGMGRGLIFFFDRNSSHIVDIITKGYNPPITTLIIIGASTALIPLLAYAQHRLFKAPFHRRVPEPGNEDTYDEKSGARLTRPHPHSSREISRLWDVKLFRGKSPNRFSV